tara:strand:- start:178 stop:921 length:744 start_codon:yes stop_codon:yes gene_type:complete
MARSLTVKENAAELLDQELSLRARKGQYGIIVLSSATDPYLQIDVETGLTRKLLEIIHHHRFPVHIITKSDGVLRDLDLLERIGREALLPTDLEDKLPGGCIITFSFSTLDTKVGARFEPGATDPPTRLETLRKVREAGFHSGVSLMPLLPYISDTAEHLEWMYRSFQEVGAAYLLPATLSLFGEGRSDSKTLVLRTVERYYPHLKDKYQRFFSHSGGMPAYYRKAFEAKTRELGLQYGLSGSIINA